MDKEQQHKQQQQTQSEVHKIAISHIKHFVTVKPLREWNRKETEERR